MYLLQQAAAEFNAVIAQTVATTIAYLSALARHADGRPIMQNTLTGNITKTFRRVPRAHFHDACALAEHIVQALSNVQTQSFERTLKATLGVNGSHFVPPAVTQRDPAFLCLFATGGRSQGKKKCGPQPITWRFCKKHTMVSAILQEAKGMKALVMQLGSISTTLPPAIAASFLLQATLNAHTANLRPGRGISKMMAGLAPECTEADDVALEEVAGNLASSLTGTSSPGVSTGHFAKKSKRPKKNSCGALRLESSTRVAPYCARGS